MGYLEEKQGLEAGEYSPTFLELDKKSGPWLEQTQAESLIAKANHTSWDVDEEQGLIRFSGGKGGDLLARMEVIGTFRPDDGTWLWAWTNPKLEKLAGGAVALHKKYEDGDIPELTTASFVCTETKSWSVSAAAAFLMEAEGCFRLPGDTQTFVALFQITELPEGQGELSTEVEPDPEEAAKALAEYAGPTALNLGGLLIANLQGSEELTLDQIIAHLHTFCDNLAELADNPISKGTPVAAEAAELASVLRQRAIFLSVPPGSPLLEEAAREVLLQLRETAERYQALDTGEDA